MRTLYDSTNPADIPTSAAMVGGYVSPSRFAWNAAGWARFPNAVKVAITPSASHYGLGVHVLDVETGDATPGQVPGWVTSSRNAGQPPTVYMNVATWPAVIRACTSAGVPMPEFWVAAWNGVQNLPSITVDGVTYTAIAHQYADPNSGSGGHYDLSIAADHWPGVDQGDEMSFDLTTPVPVPMLDANGNYVGDQKDANGNTVTVPFQDFVRFADMYTQFYGKQITALTSAMTTLTQAVAALQSAQAPSELTGTAEVTVSLAPPAKTA
jgi:hypothetical protein